MNSQCSSGWLGTWCVDQPGPESHRNLPASPSLVLWGILLINDWCGVATPVPVGMGFIRK